MSNITIEDLHTMYEDARNLPSRSELSIYTESYVFDEDKSVRWNREEVARRNRAYTEDTERLKKAKSDAYELAEEATKHYIMEETGMSRDKANILYSFAWEKYHSYVYDMLTQLDELIELYNNLKG